MKLRPLPGNIFVEGIEDEHVGRIVIPDTLKGRDMPHIGRVVSMNGARMTKKGVKVLADYKPGDKVLFKKFSGIYVEFEGRRLIQLKMRDDPMLAILE